MAQIVWTEPAAGDIAEVAEHIALDKPDAAANFVSEVLAAIERLADFPLSGRMVPEFPTDRYREIVVFPCRVIYTASPEAVVILRIIRGERLLRRSMLSSH
ncbi:MAG TPA: type II toxin-antitoxin system RelE/ParE family toxin [Phycisphaerae bacterium]|nr:type II toxin-antitoxin system RelE/ParE family toxin [Phycisphaerae bacterium]